MADEDTQAIASARETRDIVLAAALQLAKRVLDHVDEHAEEGVGYVVLDESIPGGGYEWNLTASYRAGYTFCRISGSPENDATRTGVVASPAELAAVMDGQSAAFDTQVPRKWVELAVRADDALGSEAFS